MDRSHKNGLLVVGIIAGVLSLPATWMTIYQPTFSVAGMDPEVANALSSSFMPSRLDVSGVSGTITLGFTMPIWLIVALAITACGLQFFRSSDAVVVPRALLWSLCGIAAFCMLLPFAAILAGRASLGIGWFLGAACIGLAIWALATPDSVAPTTTEERDPQELKASDDDL